MRGAHDPLFSWWHEKKNPRLPATINSDSGPAGKFVPPKPPKAISLRKSGQEHNPDAWIDDLYRYVMICIYKALADPFSHQILSHTTLTKWITCTWLLALMRVL